MLFLSAAMLLLLAVLTWSGIMIVPARVFVGAAFAIAGVVQFIFALELRGSIAGVFFKKVDR